MALTIYEVVAGGDGEDWSALVAAHSPTEARDIARYNQPRMDRPWAIYEWGTDARDNSEPGILRGPFQDYPAVCRGWKMYKEDHDSDAKPPPIIEWRTDET
jgi:hypothetical protein